MTQTREVAGCSYIPSELELATEQLGQDLGVPLSPIGVGDITTYIGRFSDPSLIYSRKTGEAKAIRLSYFRESPLHSGRLGQAFGAVANRTDSLAAGYYRLRPREILKDAKLQREMMLNPNADGLLDPLQLIQFPEKVSVVIYDKSQFEQSESIDQSDLLGKEVTLKSVAIADLMITYQQADLYKYENGEDNAANTTNLLLFDSSKRRPNEPEEDLRAPENYLEWLVRFRQHHIFRPDLSKLRYEFAADVPSASVLSFVKGYFSGTFQRPASEALVAGENNLDH